MDIKYWDGSTGWHKPDVVGN